MRRFHVAAAVLAGQDRSLHRPAAVVHLPPFGDRRGFRASDDGGQVVPIAPPSALRSAILLLGVSLVAPAPQAQEDEVTATAGHSDRRIQDVLLRVEVVGREEIEENARN